MIFEQLLTFILNFFDTITTNINIPSLNDDIFTIFDSFAEYLQLGIGVLSSYTHIGYLLSLFSIFLVVEAAILVYKIIMWVLRKIPLLGID